MRGFHRAVTEALLRAETFDDVEAEPVEFVLGQISALPPYTRLGVEIAALFLAAHTFVTTGKRFPSLSHTAQAATVRRWETLGLPPAQLYLRLLRSLTLFAAFDPSAP